jgi:hypothetical protein
VDMCLDAMDSLFARDSDTIEAIKGAAQAIRLSTVHTTAKARRDFLLPSPLSPPCQKYPLRDDLPVRV